MCGFSPPKKGGTIWQHSAFGLVYTVRAAVVVVVLFIVVVVGELYFSMLKLISDLLLLLFVSALDRTQR